MSENYPDDEQAQLLKIARETLQAITAGEARPKIDVESLPPSLREPRAVFVTLEMDGDLRGCTGTLAARRPLADEVGFTTMQTAFNDPRFNAVTAAEVPRITIEISILTPSVRLVFDGPDDLLRKLRPGVDGVTLRVGSHRSTFLPQVWERIPNPVEFLTMLCRKMNMSGDAWKRPDLEVETYQTVIMAEAHQH